MLLCTDLLSTKLLTFLNHNKCWVLINANFLSACVQVTVMVFHWSSGASEQHDLLISKPVSHWTAVEVMTWLENLGPWAQLYREAFHLENVNGR